MDGRKDRGGRAVEEEESATAMVASWFHPWVGILATYLVPFVRQLQLTRGRHPAERHQSEEDLWPGQREREGEVAAP